MTGHRMSISGMPGYEATTKADLPSPPNPEYEYGSLTQGVRDMQTEPKEISAKQLYEELQKYIDEYTLEFPRSRGEAAQLKIELYQAAFPRGALSKGAAIRGTYTYGGQQFFELQDHLKRLARSDNADLKSTALRQRVELFKAAFPIGIYEKKETHEKLPFRQPALMTRAHEMHRGMTKWAGPSVPAPSILQSLPERRVDMGGSAHKQELPQLPAYKALSLRPRIPRPEIVSMGEIYEELQHWLSEYAKKHTNSDLQKLIIPSKIDLFNAAYPRGVLARPVTRPGKLGFGEEMYLKMQDYLSTVAEAEDYDV